MEKRQSYLISKLDTRSGENGEPIIEGYFSVFGQETEIWEGMYEQIAEGAFTKYLNNDIRCLFNHNSANVMGRTTAGTLILKEDSHGLFGSLKVNTDDRMAMDVYARVKRGDISGCSFGFFPVVEEWIDGPHNTTHWTVKEADLREVSICTFPAYPQTEITARASMRNNHCEELRKKTKKMLKSRLEEKKKCLKY